MRTFIMHHNADGTATASILVDVGLPTAHWVSTTLSVEETDEHLRTSAQRARERRA